MLATFTQSANTQTVIGVAKDGHVIYGQSVGSVGISVSVVIGMSQPLWDYGYSRFIPLELDPGRTKFRLGASQHSPDLRLGPWHPL